MRLFCLGLNHKTAPVEVRERFSVPSQRIDSETQALTQLPGVHEAVILSTCNRMELYLAVDQPTQVKQFLFPHLQQRFQVEQPITEHFYSHEGAEAAKHLCAVASGLNSMVLGETEIFGQVKSAYQQALASGHTGPVLNKVFQSGFNIGKSVRTKTQIGEGTTSVGAAAVDLAEKIFGKLTDCKVLILGAGEMSRVTAQSLRLRGAKTIFVANRSYDRALELANMMDGEAVRFEDWTQRLIDVDIVIASTSAPHAVVEKQHIEKIRSKRKYRSLFLIDIAVPRDIDPTVAQIEEVYLYDIDTLEQLAEDGRQQRQRQIQLCETIILEELSKRQLPGI